MISIIDPFNRTDESKNIFKKTYEIGKFVVLKCGSLVSEIERGAVYN